MANRTCRKCGKIFPPPPEGQLCRPLGNHEKWCKGVPVGAQGPAPADAAGAGPAAVPPVGPG
eukprot:4507862-Pyramimonas_sp.AAC.1